MGKYPTLKVVSLRARTSTSLRPANKKKSKTLMKRLKRWAREVVVFSNVTCASCCLTLIMAKVSIAALPVSTTKSPGTQSKNNEQTHHICVIVSFDHADLCQSQGKGPTLTATTGIAPFEFLYSVRPWDTLTLMTLVSKNDAEVQIF